MIRMGGFGRGGGGECRETEYPNKGGGTKTIAGAVWKAEESCKPSSRRVLGDMDSTFVSA